MTTATHTKPKRRFLRFSVRTLLLLMLVFGVVLGWKVERARKQREAVAWVLEMGGTVFYNYQLDDDQSYVPDAKPRGPEWLRKRLGSHFFDDVVYVYELILSLFRFNVATKHNNFLPSNVDLSANQVVVFSAQSDSSEYHP